MPKKLVALIILLVGFAGLMSGTLFKVAEPVQAVVFQFGDPRRVIQEPGLNWKIPFIQDIQYFDKRILNLDPQPAELPLADQKRIIVDSYARYKITDPLKFFQTVQGSERAFNDAFGRILNRSVRDAIAKVGMVDLLSQKRVEVMSEIVNSVSKEAPDYGVTIVDVRIGRADLPAQISENVFDRMRTDRVQEANKLRAEGDEIKQRIEAEAEREKTVILAEARRTSNILRGQGDAQRNVVLGEAYGKDPEFFRFYRSMEAYREALGEGTSMVLSPDSEFFSYFGMRK
ncbi:Protein HflC [Candidatus Terasakiella magnetica]|uniref:Protein HflC n=1 Tax=Candidatus Terasakiella magnetica TaxID=1867952 RepID=A0A1C3RGT0_9PROT|nr:protease modulator HflC [Candidatus Terasakiella magnetica]SCA56503.1 Protein HflC [Candidatus Terasakiella magnetica]